MKRILFLLIILSLIPASILVLRRVQAEGRRVTVTLIMDEPALEEQAQLLGQTSLELAKRYQSLGLNGVALYEESFESLEVKGDIAVLDGPEAIKLALSRGEERPKISSNSILVSEIEPDALSWILAKNLPKPQKVELLGRSWYAYPGSTSYIRPAGPVNKQVRQWHEAGFDIAYRPRNFPAMQRIGEDFPPEAHYLIHGGLQVAGYPNRLDDLVDRSQTYLTGIIEGTEQDGMDDLSRKVPTARLLSFNQDYINQRLRPQDLIDKYLLAANERGIRIFYLRPYTEEQLGDMFVNTEALITGLTERLEREGYEIGPLPQLDVRYETNALLRGLSALGILAALGLIIGMYPGAWGIFIAVSLLGLGLLTNGLDWGALAFVAALSFPVIGYAYLPERLSSLGLASLISLAGAMLLSAVGSDKEAILAITPFAGVAATLIVPPALFLFHYALRYHRPAAWVMKLWNYPIRLGNIIIFMFAILALGIVFLRRGNFPIIGASSAELGLRNWLSDLFVRPRFKELLGHPLAVLGLSNTAWASWIKASLLTGGVIAQASILNSFSHYHTPLLISLQRTLIALGFGLVIGLILLPLGRLLVYLAKHWLKSAKVQEA